jgi:hypothetical protein
MVLTAFTWVAKTVFFSVALGHRPIVCEHVSTHCHCVYCAIDVLQVVLSSLE